MLIQDNQQVTKNWFIGFFEGESYFQARRKNHDCVIRITNTELDSVYACDNFLKSNGILSYVIPRKKVSDNKQAYDVYISGNRECKILYEIVKNEMTCRLDEFESIIGTSTTKREPSLELDWLIGLYEAEACFTIKTQWNINDCVSYKPSVAMKNTNKLIIEKTIKILRTNGLAWYVYDSVQTLYKPYQDISIVGFKRVNSFLSKTEGLWVGSKTRRKVKLLREFCDSRLSKAQKEPYSAREHQIALEIKMKI